MKNTRIGVLGAIVGVVSLLVTVGPTFLLNRWVARENAFPAWLPTLGSYGETTVGYSLLLDVVPPALTLALALALGYYVGGHLDLDTDYRRFLASVSVGSTVGVVLTWGVLALWIGLYGLGDATDAAFSLATFVAQFVDVALVVVLGAVTGATATHFQSGGDPRSPVGSEASSSPQGESPTDTDEEHSEPV